MPGPETAPEAMAFTVDFMKACNKTPVVMKKFGPGFIVNRIQRAIGETCMDMVQEGLVEPEQIDDAIKATLGIRLPIVGVMQTFDFQGLDMLLAYQKNVGKVYAFVEDRVNAGRNGAKSGAGIYDYQGRTEAQILQKRDELYLKMIDYLTEIGAFEPLSEKEAMAVTNYAKLLEPGMIGKVKTRNRIYKSAAGMHSFEEYEFESMNDNTLGFYDALSKGGVGIIASRRLPLTTLRVPLAPSLPHGRRQVHPGDEAARRSHPQQRLPDLHADGARRAMAEPAVPQPSRHV